MVLMEIKMPRVIKPDGTEIKRLNPIDAKVTLNITPLSTASLTLRKGESVASRSFVEIYTCQGSAGVFRTKAPKPAYGGQATSVDLESALSEVGDYIIKTTIKDQETTLKNAVKLIFGQYKGANWKLGSVPADAVTLKGVKGNVLAAILAVMKQVPDTHIVLNFSSWPWTVSIVKNSATVEAEGRLSRNITSAIINQDESSLCTRLYVPGINKSGYIQADTYKTYGCIEAELTGTENYTQAQRERAANNYLNAHKQPRVSVSISGAELSAITKEPLDKFSIGKRFRLTIPEDKLTVEEIITQVSWGNVYGAPTKVTVTLSQEEESAITFLEQQSSSISGAYDYTSNVEQNMNQKIEANDDKYSSRFEVTEKAIEAEAKRSSAKDGEFEALLKVTNDAITTEVARAKKAENGKISQTSSYKTVNDLISKAKDEASKAATTAKNACIAKTGVYQTADSILQAAVAESLDEAGDTFIAQTYQYQTADAIVQTAKNYVNGKGYDSKLEQQANQISLVVESRDGTNVIKAAEIVTSINEQTGQSIVKLSADVIDIDGLIRAMEASIITLTVKSLAAYSGYIDAFEFDTIKQGTTQYQPVTVTIGGTQYKILAATV